MEHSFKESICWLSKVEIVVECVVDFSHAKRFYLKAEAMEVHFFWSEMMSEYIVILVVLSFSQ